MVTVSTILKDGNDARYCGRTPRTGQDMRSPSDRDATVLRWRANAQSFLSGATQAKNWHDRNDWLCFSSAGFEHLNRCDISGYGAGTRRRRRILSTEAAIDRLEQFLLLVQT